MKIYLFIFGVVLLGGCKKHDPVPQPPVRVYTVTTIAGDGTPGYAEGAAIQAEFKFPFAVALDGAGDLYVADAMNFRVRKITPAAVVSTLAGDGIRDYLDGPGRDARFSSVMTVATDAAGNVYTTDGDKNVIRKITPAGFVSTIAGDTSSGFKDGRGSAARFFSPAGVATDGGGNIYVADYFTHSIRKVSPDGDVITIAGDGMPGHKDGTGAGARFYNPIGIAIDRAGNLYVADEGNNMIRKITPARVVTTIAGDTAAGFRDATGRTARFISPIGIAVDAGGNVYVGDWGNHRIRKIAVTGDVTTIAGDGQLGLKDGPAAAARFKYPCGLAIDGAGTIYIADQGNHCIRKLE